MANEKETTGKDAPVKQEQTFDRKLITDGWNTYYVSAHIKDLDNPDKKQGTFGLTDAVGKKQIVINLPAEEIIDALTKFAKKQASK